MVGNVRAILIALGLSGMSACAPGEVLLGEPPQGYVEDAKARVAAAEWSKAETVTVALSEFRFTPQELEFRKGAPYRLRIENRGKLSHTFDAEGFFAAIAVQKVRSGGSETALPYVKRLVVASEEATDLYFVAVTPGTYDLECSVPLHDTFGMTGRIVIR
ncbi:MAG: cupredoxin domain-containing protein [Proteobacteria bacterium]|nr:cupredoxin domain-containing protein [Pseudomonadota bacterium]